MRVAGLALIAVAAAAGCSPAPIEVATLGTRALTNGLLAHWALDEGSGASVADGSGNGHDGVLQGPAYSWIAGKFGGAVHFSGSDLVAVAGFPPATSSYSVSAWLLIGPNEMGGPLSNLVSTDVLGGGWALYGMGGGAYLTYIFHYAIPGSQQYVAVDGNGPQPNTWTHLTAVLDADAGALTLYVGTTAAMTIPIVADIAPGSTTLYMARSAALQPPFPLTGALDDIAIYNRPLQPEEIAALESAPAPDPP
jgi:hypothetical protein